jgi:hypothetical protein
MDVQKNPARRFKLVLCFIAILLALAITFFMRSFLTPYQLELIDHNSDFSYIVYHDFDKDGISEKLEGHNERSKDSYWISVLNHSGNYLDECNYVEPTRFNFETPWLVFGDYNDDDLDEIFAFTQAGDSLFLYMHDLRRKQVIIKRQFLLKNQFPIEYPGRRFVVISGGLIDLTKSGNKALVFAVWSFASLQPRGVYVYDVQEQMIIRRLENYVAWGDLFFYDLSGDGKEEIILTGHAYGNVHHLHPQSDDRCWLFVLDHYLKPIFEPIPLGEYPSTLRAKAIETNSERHLRLALNYRGEKNVLDFVCLINSEGKLLPQFQGKFRTDYVRSPLVSKSISEPYIFISGDGNELIKMNGNLKITDRKLTSANWSRVSELIDLDRDGVEELLCLLDGQLSIYSQELELLAQIPLLSSWGHETYFTFRATDPQKPLDIGVGAVENNFYLYAYKKNLIYSLLPIISIGLGSFIFMILIGGYRFSWLAYTYIRYTRSSLKNAQNGVALLDSHGMIYFFNEKLEKHLRVKMNNGKRLHYAHALQERPQVIRAIQTCMETGEPVHQQIVIRDKDYQFECEIDVAPFISPLKLIRSYLVEIKESAYFTYGDRIQSWSNSVQEIAHKIKTPLSSIALNLKAFQM